MKDDTERAMMDKLSKLVAQMDHAQIDLYCREVDYIEGWRTGAWPEKLELAREILGVKHDKAN
jgi:hypothetical protein